MGNALEDLTTAYTTLFIDLPLSSLKRSLGLAEEKETTEAAWKVYDASIRLASSAIDRLSRTPLFGEATARSLDLFLQGQRLTHAFSGAIVTSLWNTVGLPTAAETQALREEIRPLTMPLAVRPKTKAPREREHHTTDTAQAKHPKSETVHFIRAVA